MIEKATLKDKIKSIDYRYYILIILTLGLLALSFVYKNSLIRAYETVRDFVFSIGFYFTKIFTGESNVPVTVLEPSNVKVLEGTFDTLKISINYYFKAFANKSVFLAYVNVVVTILFLVLTLGFSLFFVMIAVYFLLKTLIFQKNNKYGVRSKSVVFYENFKQLFLPVNLWIQDFLTFVMQRKRLIQFWLFIALLYLNVFSIAVGVMAWFFYFFVAFDTVSFFIMLFKLFQDIQIMFSGLPKTAWYLIAIFLFHWLRKEIAYKRLAILERRNRGFIENLPIVSMVNGTMGSRKTTIITDMAISQVSLFRYRAKETMFKIQMKYKNFNFLLFEKWIQWNMSNKHIYNLASIEKRLNYHKKIMLSRLDDSFKFYIHKKSKFKGLFDYFWKYDFIKYSMAFDDALTVRTIYEDLLVYASAYFIYVTNNFVVSNYSIRLDDQMVTIGNAIDWDDDFFRRKASDIDEISRYSKILDFDVLRLGKKVVEDNVLAGSFEFGVVNITEIGKERLNQVESRGLSKTSDIANQLNDMFNYWLKLARHPGTVDFNPYVRVFCDEQRDQSLGADARELAALVNIDDLDKDKISMPFFILEDWLCESLVSRLRRFYEKYRFFRADETAIFRFVRFLASKLYCYRLRIHNRFNYTVVFVGVEAGKDKKGGTKYDNQKYYLMDKKIYSKRFATDAFRDYFHQKAAVASVGLNDYESYKNVTASLEELQKQNSFFINKILEIGGKENDNKI